MEWPVRRLSLIVFLSCLMGAMAGGIPPAAHDNPSDWKPLAPGLDLRSIKARHPSIVGDSQITVLRIDPARWQLEATGVAQTGEAAGHTAREWGEMHQYTAVINAGMFESDQKSHLGYLRYHDHVYASRVNNYQSVMAFDPREGKKVPGFHIFDLDAPGVTLQTVLADYASVVQNLRLIKHPGTNQWERQTRQWSEAAVGEDSAGNILFIYSRSPFSMHDLNEELLAAGIGIVAAQHMEGGPEAQLYVHAGATKMEMFGSFETSFEEDDHNSAAWPVPNVLGVRPRISTDAGAVLVPKKDAGK